MTNPARCDTLVLVSKNSSHTLTAERRSAIADLVMQRGSVHVKELASRFEVSPATIRRDLEALEGQETLRRVYGGAVAVEGEIASPSEGPEPPQSSATSRAKSALDDSEEARIGQAVADMIADGETVFLGPGTLPVAVARCLQEHTRITVVTNGLEAAHWLVANTPHNHLIVTGGQVEERDRALVGQLTKGALSKLRADRVILELGGVNPVEGLTHDSLPQAEIAQLLLESGSEVIIMTPAERIGRVAAAHVAPISEADVIITAREAPSPFLWDLSEIGVRIILV